MGSGSGSGTPGSPVATPGSSASPAVSLVDGLGERRLRQMACGEQAALALTHTGAVMMVNYSTRDRQVGKRSLVLKNGVFRGTAGGDFGGW